MKADQLVPSQDGESFVGVDSPSYNYKKFFLMSTFTSILVSLSVLIFKQSYTALLITIVYLFWVFETGIKHYSTKEEKTE